MLSLQLAMPYYASPVEHNQEKRFYVLLDPEKLLQVHRGELQLKDAICSPITTTPPIDPSTFEEYLELGKRGDGAAR